VELKKWLATSRWLASHVLEIISSIVVDFEKVLELRYVRLLIRRVIRTSVGGGGGGGGGAYVACDGAW